MGCGLVHATPRQLTSHLVFEKFSLKVQFSAATPDLYAVFPGWLADQGQIFNADLTFEREDARTYSITSQQFAQTLINVEIFGRY